MIRYLILVTLIFFGQYLTLEARTVSVNVIEDLRPISFINEDGKPDGLYVNLIEKIAQLDDWELIYYRNSWSSGMQKLREGEIDLLFPVIKTKERSEFLDFHQQPVTVAWGQVVVRSDSGLAALTDLAGKKVGIVEGDQNGINFKKIAGDLHIDCQLFEIDSYSKILPLIEDGYLDAGIFFNTYNLDGYGVKATSILFNPIQGHFATTKGTNPDVLEAIDRQLALWKKDKDSYYYKVLNTYFSSGVEKRVVPKWLLYGSSGALGLLCLSVLWIVSLKVLVNRRTIELKKSEHRFYQTLKNSPIAMASSDDQGLVEFLNNRFVEIFGYTMDDFSTDEEWFVCAYPDAAMRQKVKSEWLNRLNVYKQTGHFAPHEAAVTCKDGSTKIIRFNFEAVESNHIHSFVDITELRETERALRESEELHRALIEQSPIGLALCAMDGLLVSINPAFAKIIGYSVDDALKLSYWEITPEKYSLEEKRQLEQLELHGRYGPYEKEYRHKNGHLVPVRLSGMRVIRDGKQLIWSSVEDITALKNAEIEKAEMAEQLRQSQKMEAIGTLAGGIAHDFNNILSAVLGYTELTLLNSDCDAKMRRNLNRVLDAAGRAKDLVRQILMFSRKGEVNRQPVQIELVVEEVVNLLRKTIPSTITIDLDVASNMVTVLADTTQIHQVVMNLCTNAHHSMLELGGRIDICLKLADSDLALATKYPNLREGKYVQLTVADSGVGMSPEILSCIFDPFFTTKRAGEGTGMGLAVVHGIIQSHDGVIDVESEPGIGTQVTIFFPLSSDVAEIKTIAGDTPTIKGDSEHILWVDDEPMLVELGRETLESFGYRVTATTSALEALRLFKADPNGYDLIVTDQAMPEMAGELLAKEAMSVRSDVSIIICTGYSAALNAEKATTLGVKKLLMKPLDVDKLAEEIRRVLSESA